MLTFCAADGTRYEYDCTEQNLVCHEVTDDNLAERDFTGCYPPGCLVEGEYYGWGCDGDVLLLQPPVGGTTSKYVATARIDCRAFGYARCDDAHCLRE